MDINKHKYLGFLGLLSLIGLKGFFTENYLWFILFVNFAWFTFFYENSIVYKKNVRKVELGH
ncbi:MAG: DUF3796 domain-containing protein [Clostridium sp.]